MILRRVTTLLAAASMAVSPAIAATDASSLSIARAAPALSDASFLQDEGDSNHGGGSTALILGGVMLILIAVVAIAGSSHDPVSP